MLGGNMLMLHTFEVEAKIDIDTEKKQNVDDKS
jgi:hypothetical protein